LEEAADRTIRHHIIHLPQGRSLEAERQAVEFGVEIGK